MHDTQTELDLAEDLEVAPIEQDRLAQHPDRLVRLALAGNPRLLPQFQHALALDGCDDVVMALAANRRLDPTVQDRLVAAGRPGVLQALAVNPSLASTHMVALARTETESWFLVRKGLASNPNLQHEAAGILARDPSAAVRGELAGNPGLPADVARGLAGDVPEVRGRVARNGCLPADELPALVVGANPAEDLPTDARRFLASRSDLPLSAQRVLMADPDAGVRRELAGNAGLDPSLQIGIVSDADEGVRAALAANSSLDPALQLRLLEAGVESVNMALAGRADLQREAFRTLLRRARSTESIEALREGMSSGSDTRRWSIWDLKREQVARLAAALSGDAQVRRRTVASPDPLVRLASTVNAGITQEQLRQLLDDEDPDVRSLAKVRLLAIVATA